MPVQRDSEKAQPIASGAHATPMTNEELEAGLRVMAQGDAECGHFWDEHVVSFRQTVLLGIRETSDLLLLPTVSARWRGELEPQLKLLVRCLDLADRYIEVNQGKRAVRH